MTQKVAITQSDGTLAVMIFVVHGRGPQPPPGAIAVNDGSGRWVRDPNNDNIAQEVNRAFPGCEWHLIGDAEIPTDRTYRDAWRNNGNSIIHDIGRAKEIHRGLVRSRRDAIMATLDGPWMRAVAKGDTVAAAAIDAKRQALRDAPGDPRIEAAQTVEELKAITLPG